MEPSEFYTDKIPLLIKVRGECWEWQGGYNWDAPYCRLYTREYVNVRGVAFLKSEGIRHRKFVVSCGNLACVHPDHIFTPHSDVGRMIFIAENSAPEGECLIWKGPVSKDGIPNLNGVRPVHGYIDIKQRAKTLNVKTYVHWLETNRWVSDRRLVNTCGVTLCVSHKHLQELRNQCMICRHLHNEDSCPKCTAKYAKVSESRATPCERGHDPRYDGNSGASSVDNCYLCRREDAAAFIAARNKEMLRSYV